MSLKFCQGPDCHTYHTQDRLKGPKGNKTYQTRRRSRFYYLGGNACDMRCQQDWFDKYGTRALDHFGRITEAKHLTEENAWTKRENYYSWQRENNEPRYYTHNAVTREERPLTEAQFNDSNYTLNTGE